MHDNLVAVRVSTPNRSSCLMLYDVTNYNDVTCDLCSYEYERNVRFTGV